MDIETTQQKIKSIAERFKGCHYCFMSWAQLNDALTNITDDKPVICYLLPPTGTFKVKNNADALIDQPLTEISFLSLSKLDEDGEKDDLILAQMRYLAQCFLREMNKSGLFEMIDGVDIPYECVYQDRTDDTFIGITITLPLEAKPFYMCGETTDFDFE